MKLKEKILTKLQVKTSSTTNKRNSQLNQQNSINKSTPTDISLAHPETYSPEKIAKITKMLEEEKQRQS